MTEPAAARRPIQTKSDMPLPRQSLRAFLTSARSALSSHSSASSRQPLHFVIGNESADLDSISSALTYAYFRSHAPPHNLHIPLFNIPRADIAIRPELLTILPRAGLEPSHLLTLDDLPPLDVLPPEHTQWTLVDHNALTGPLTAYASRVTGCVDHHAEEHAVPKDTGDEPRIVEVAGSCTSLVVNYLQSTWDTLTASTTKTSAAASSSATDTQGDAPLARLALASILIDTSALRDSGKTTPSDEKAVAYLESALSTHDASYDRATYLAEIKAAKFDLDRLTTNEVLRKDYKQWTAGGVQLGVSSVVKELGWLIGKAGDESEGRGEEENHEAFVRTLRSFTTERDLSVYAIMTTSHSSSGKFQRELLLWARDARAREMLKNFQEMAGEQLELEGWNHVQGLAAQSKSADVKRDGEGAILEVWWQRKVDASRKQVAPLLRRAIEG